jgi:hypothetical protein
MVAEPNGDVVLYGGLTFTGFLADTWLYNPTTNAWAQQHPTNSPSARYGAAMDSTTFNPLAVPSALLFGGSGATGEDSDTWFYNFGSNNWTLLSVSGTVPTARYGAGLAYEANLNEFVLFGGDTTTGYSAATYSFSPATDTWATLAPTTSPSPRAGFGFAFNPEANTAVLFGGWNGTNFLGDSWELPG